MSLFGNLFKPRETSAQRAEWMESTLRTVAGQVQARMVQDLRQAQRNFEAAETPAYTESWSTSEVHINEALARQLPTLWARSAGLARNNEWAAGYLTALDDNVLGPNGIQLQMRLKKARSEEYDRDTNRAFEDAWAKWGENADVSGLPWDEVETLAINTLARRGELLYRLLPGSGPMGFQVQMLDPTLLDVTLNRAWGGNRIRMGKEIDDAGKPVAYWLQVAKQGDAPAGYVTVGRHVRVPASEIVHRYVVEEVGQLRGIPWLTIGARRLWLLHDFEESAAVASSNAAKQIGFFVSPDGNAPPGFADTIVSSVLDAAKAAGKVLTPDEIKTITAAAEKFQTLAPGTWDTIPQGYDVRFNQSQWPNVNADTYTKGHVRAWSAARGISYVTAGNDLEAVNYSSAQVGILGEREHHKKTQTRLRKWLHAPVLHAAAPYLALAAQGLRPSLVDAYRAAATWQPRRWAPLDPNKTANANETNLRLDLTSRRRIVLERGEDPDELFAEIAEEKKLFGAIAPANGNAAPAEPDDDETKPAKSRHLHLAAARGLENGD
ncbi:phage portal protein [Thiobacillus sp. 65-1402]|uniref:phage portal protein n=1 Tax=Thiobacillus sp. 65-1402 TaxID=1895861 RepID=UPI0009632400|nr:phage portal protein [Thiobacillus sp. 65-1402]OJW77985.1 MAG: phage portal protein [Thiobacillus sp. 65-1402]